MELNTLTALSPIDGRYRKSLQHLDEYFSEYGLFKYRLFVEIEYLLALGQAGLPQMPSTFMVCLPVGA